MRRKLAWFFAVGTCALACADLGGLTSTSTSPDASAPDDAGADGARSGDSSADSAADGSAACDAGTRDPRYLNDAIQVGLGIDFGCALRESGEVVCWGANGKSQLGRPANAVSNVPRPVQGLTGKMTHLAVGDRHACAVDTATQMWCWGDGSGGQLGMGAAPGPALVTDQVGNVLSGAIDIGAGSAFSCALFTGGFVQCWGSNGSSQLGKPKDGASYPTPQPIPRLGSGATSLAVASNHACVRQGKDVLCWGSDDFGQLGIGVPLPEGGVATPGTYPVTTAATTHFAGHEATCIIDVAGNVVCSGANNTFQFGIFEFVGRISDPTALQAFAGLGAKQVALGEISTCIVDGKQRAQCIGTGYDGALGRGFTKTDYDLKPAPVVLRAAPDGGDAGDGVLGPVASVAISGVDLNGPGYSSACALLKQACARSGSISCWGSNQLGQLGDGTTKPSGAPVPVLAPVP